MLDQLLTLAARAEAYEKALDEIAKQRTVFEWEEFARGEGLDPDGGDYTGAYDAIVREARTALASQGASR
jgi:hypothetical protein